MKISDLMTPDVQIVHPDQTVEQAARLMAELDAGVLPVGDDERLTGMVTDRDIAVRVLQKGRVLILSSRDHQRRGKILLRRSRY